MVLSFWFLRFIDRILFKFLKIFSFGLFFWIVKMNLMKLCKGIFVRVLIFILIIEVIIGLFSGFVN